MTRKSGFTLVELSIVLVIIGLLIGGILVAQSMIETVKVQRMVRDLQQYEIAAQNFKTNFKTYPGDSANFTPPGNANNVLGMGATCASSPNTSLSGQEYYQVYAHLTQSKMLDKTYVPFADSNCPGGTHNGFFNDSYAGVLWPYTELKGAAASYWGMKKYPLVPSKLTAAANFNYRIMVNPMDVFGLEAKLGNQPFNATETSVGLVNLANGNGMCYDPPATVTCLDTTAVYAEFAYYLPPI